MLEHDRKIAAILAADVVDYSRLMGIDEESTLAALKLRRSIFERLVAGFGGHEFGSVGDSLMAQFPSAVNAVRCAQAIQQAVAIENGSLAPERRMQLRIGINLGDVIEEKGTLFGDGVNVAARLQSLAAPGGILVSGAVHEQVRNKVAASLSFAGERQVKNIRSPVATYEVLASAQRRMFLKAFAHDVHRRRVVVAAVLVALIAGGFWYWRSDLRLPGLEPRTQVAAEAEPSVAVLPFVNMSSEADNEPFADGLSEEVLNVLAGIEGLKVAGRTSSFYFKGKNEKPDVIGATLGVNHLLEGSVRWSGSKVRITAQLIDASNGFHLWSQSFDRDTTDIFAVQEEIARAVAGALQVKLLTADEARLSARGTKDPEAYRLYLVARGRLRERGLSNLRAAKALFEKAIERDPQYANAYSGLADAYYLLISNHGQELEQGERLGEQAANKAIELDPQSSEAYASRANFKFVRYTHGESGELERAVADYRRAVELNPSNAQAYHWYGVAVAATDDTARALELFEQAVALDPLMLVSRLTASRVFMYRGQFDQARAHIRQVIERYPDFSSAYLTLAEVEWTVGRLTDARSWYAKAYDLSAEPSTATFAALLSYELDDRASATEWLGRVTGNAYFDGFRQAFQLSIDGQHAQAFEACARLVGLGPDDEWLTLVSVHLALLAKQAERATMNLLKRHPELAGPEVQVVFENSEAAILLAASWQRTGRRPDADRLLRQVGTWLDGSDAPRWPQTHIARAQVYALLGERTQAFEALDRAFNAGHRGALTRVFFAYPIRSEDNTLLESIRGDLRFAAYYARIHADNARQLAQLKTQQARDR